MTPDQRQITELLNRWSQGDKRALDEAYHAQLQNLWLVWLKGQAGDPTYFTNGLKIARRAYGQAVEQIARREKQLEQTR